MINDSLKDYLDSLDTNYLGVSYKKGEYQDLINKISALYYNIKGESDITFDYYEIQNVVLQLLLSINDNLSKYYPIDFKCIENEFTSKIIALYKENLKNVIFKPFAKTYISFKPYELDRFNNEIVNKQKAIREFFPFIAVNSLKEQRSTLQGDHYRNEILEIYRATPFIDPLSLYKCIQKNKRGALADEVFSQVEKLLFKRKLKIDKETGAMLVVGQLQKVKGFLLEDNKTKISEELIFLEKKYLEEYDKDLDRIIDFALNYMIVSKLKINSNYINNIVEDVDSKLDFFTLKSISIEYLLAEFEAINQLKIQEVSKSRAYEELYVFISVLQNDYFKTDELGYFMYDKDKFDSLIGWLIAKKEAIYELIDDLSVEYNYPSEEINVKDDKIANVIEVEVREKVLDERSKIDSFDLETDYEVDQKENIILKKQQEDLIATDKTVNQKEENQAELKNPVLDNPYLCKYIDKVRLLKERKQIESIFIKYKQPLTVEQVKELMYVEYSVDIKTNKIVDVIVWLLDKVNYDNKLKSYFYSINYIISSDMKVKSSLNDYLYLFENNYLGKAQLNLKRVNCPIRPIDIVVSGGIINITIDERVNFYSLLTAFIINQISSVDDLQKKMNKVLKF